MCSQRGKSRKKNPELSQLRSQSSCRAFETRSSQLTTQAERCVSPSALRPSSEARSCSRPSATASFTSRIRFGNELFCRDHRFVLTENANDAEHRNLCCHVNRQWNSVEQIFNNGSCLIGSHICKLQLITPQGHKAFGRRLFDVR